jgi:hypothetical protein
LTLGFHRRQERSASATPVVVPLSFIGASLRLNLEVWNNVADNLKKAGWCCGCISSTDHNERQFWVVAAERADAVRFIVHAAEKLSAFLDFQRRFELAGNCLDRLATFLPNSASLKPILNQAEDIPC